MCFKSKNYNPKPLNGIPGPLGVIESGRAGDFNKDSRIMITASVFIILLVLCIIVTSLSPVSCKNLCSVMYG